MLISVIICTHNPKLDILNQALDGLRGQSLPMTEWELIIIDNATPNPVASFLEVAWHPNSKIITEEQLGLSHARLRGVNEAQSDMIIFVDDDNILDRRYLQLALEFHQKNPKVGCFGGKSLPVYETTPPPWFFESGISLGCQDCGDKLHISNIHGRGSKIKDYPEFAPIGTGMVILKHAFQDYHTEVLNSQARLSLGRKGASLRSGEDNDVVLTIIRYGYEIAYLPELVVKHLIPRSRFSLDYLKRMAYESNRSWIAVLAIHGINPWKPCRPWLLPFKLAKAKLTIKPWKSELNAIKYQSSKGKLKGLSEI